MWMPKKLLYVELHCPHPACEKKELTSAGIYPRVRQVLDIDGYYSLAAEYLECSRCKRKVISWSDVIIKQLDVGHCLQFPVILTYRYACDVRVIRMLRQCGLRNNLFQLQKKLLEQHSEAWLQKTAHYLTDCKAFADANLNRLVLRPSFVEPPPAASVPKYKWLLSAYCHDVMLRLDEIKSSITSTFGQVLKMDSTKKVVKKLAGHSAGTASWATNIGNEHGQVLMSVLTASEGCGLGPMVAGIVGRYDKAGVPPPKLLYVDRGCCGRESQLRAMFAAWPDLCIRLDVWHFMSRFAIGCTTDAHQLYGIFMGHLSQCIFEWNREDLQALKKEKQSKLVMQHVDKPSDTDVIKRISKKELSTHCRRRTRGVDQTSKLIAQLLEAFDGEQGLDTLSLPLLDKGRIWDIWESQKQHIACIQDSDDVQLYTETATLVKGGISLLVYRCACGSTSLGSFISI
ncbi:uncharacterized protein LOC121382599 [Gigantopelta aegis]|uniref:uncharacterized protein LOC121382599 n=1 Tax=Gigantopelta aegis TaxID=1735272 RepID=UPI001B88A9CC|nr:uncharacterized protein LOC121382599 [Gigantopelta aegis]